MSTAENTKSTSDATFSTSLTFMTTISFTASGIGVFIFQRSPTASSYLLPALLGEAAMTFTSNLWWFSRSDMNRCPTIPVPPRIPTLNLSLMSSSSSLAGLQIDQIVPRKSRAYFINSCTAPLPGPPFVILFSTHVFKLMAS